MPECHKEIQIYMISLFLLENNASHRFYLYGPLSHITYYLIVNSNLFLTE